MPLHSDMDDEIQRRRRSNTGHGGSGYQQYRYRDEDDDEYEVQGQFEFNISRSSICEIEEEEDDRDEDSNYSIGGSNSVIPVEIRELFGGKRYFPMPSIKEEQYDHINGRLLSDSSSPDNSNGDNIIDCVYVAVGKSESSMDALNYAVKQLLNTNSILYLIHIFPEIKSIPSPLGKLPKSQVSPEQVENYMTQESGKRRQLLQKFLDTCSAANVKVDTLLVESDMIAKAILDLIPILNIKKLVLGTNKSNLRKLMSGKGGSGIVDYVLQSAPQGCAINIICEGNPVMINDSLSPRNATDDHIKPKTIIGSTLSPGGNDDNPNSIPVHDQRNNEAFSFLCFKPKFSHS